MRIHRYTQWDGTQQVLFPTTDDLLKHLSDNLLEEEGVRRALRDLMRRGLTSEDGQRSVKGMRDLLREAEERRRELLNKYSPDSFKLSPEEQRALSEKLNSLAEKLEAYHETMRNFMERLSGKYADNMDEMTRRMQEAYQRYQQLRNRLQNQIPERGMQQPQKLSGQLRGLEHFLRWGQRGMGDPSELDLEEIRNLLGEEAYENLKYLKGVEQMLEEEGYIVRTGHGTRLTPKGIRKIGDKALREIFQMLNKSRWDNHTTALRGSQGDRLEETKKYEFGDPLHVDISETLLNALAKRKAGDPLRIAPDDFSVHRVEYSTASETALLIDVSYSMLMNDALHAGKKVAIALHRLIETKYPQDTLHLVAFRSNAKLIKAEDLPSIVSLTYFMEHGTDIKEALSFARQLLGPNRSGNRQIILITDGEPTAASLDRGGRLHSGWGSALLHSRIVHETLKEVKRCTQSGIKINTFMLGADFYRQGFIDQLSRLNTGRVFYTSPDQMGNYIVVDYITNKRKRIGRA